MAIAHGGIDGHVQSDWLVDCAVIIGGGHVDWPLFIGLVLERRLEAPTAIVLSYLGGPLKVGVPAEVLARLKAGLRLRPVRLFSGLMLARPKRQHSPLSALGRGVARAARMTRKAWMIRRLDAAERASRPTADGARRR